MLHAGVVRPGDALILGSDGLWDNLHDSEVAAAVQAGVDTGLAPAAIARALAAAAYEKSTQKRGSTPYSAAATDAFDMVYCGGKRDDITVLCVLIDEQPPPQPAASG
jgi:protein phosphatase PTC7